MSLSGFLLKRKTYKKKVDFFCKMSIFQSFLEFHISSLKSIFYYPEYQKMLFSGFFCTQKKKHKRKRSIFWQKAYLLQNVDFFRLCENFTFEVQKALFSIQNIKKCFFLAFFAQKKHIRKRSIFWQKPWTNPFAKCRFFRVF